MEHKYKHEDQNEDDNQNKSGNQRGQLELWQSSESGGIRNQESGSKDQGPRTKDQEPRTKDRRPRNCRRGAKKQSNIHLLFNTKTQFVHSPGNHQQTSPAGILLLLTHIHTRVREDCPLTQIRILEQIQIHTANSWQVRVAVA